VRCPRGHRAAEQTIGPSVPSDTSTPYVDPIALRSTTLVHVASCRGMPYRMSTTRCQTPKFIFNRFGAQLEAAAENATGARMFRSDCTRGRVTMGRTRGFCVAPQADPTSRA